MNVDLSVTMHNIDIITPLHAESKSAVSVLKGLTKDNCLKDNCFQYQQETNIFNTNMTNSKSTTSLHIRGFYISLTGLLQY